MSESDNSEGNPKINSPQESISASLPVLSTEQVSESTNRTKLIQQAQKFLEKDEIRNTDKEKKTAFLRTKGLKDDEVEGLLREKGKTRLIVPQVTDTSSLLINQEKPQSAIVEPVAQRSSLPPIITYPEFLINPSPRPAPLLTANHLLTILYSTTLLTATLYGTLEYVVSPMILKLTDCRHELFSSTLSNLESLSQKLEHLVSEIPVIVKPYFQKERNIESEEIEDDPTELFHRDIGIQTSPPGSPSETKNADLAQEPITHQTAHLGILHNYLKLIPITLAEETRKDAELEDAIADLKKYLNTIAYPSIPISNYESVYLSNGTMAGYTGGNNVNGEVNEITKVLKEIKGMKGLLLSARTFPGLKVGLYPK